MIIGIDIGTQSLKAVAVDDAMTVRGQGARAYAAQYPAAGWAEQHAALWESALKPAIRAALAAAGCAPEDVRALGIAGQLDGCIAVDARGTPLTPCLIWMDRRAQAEVADIDTDLIRARGGITRDPGHMAAKVRWLKRHLDSPAAMFHQPVSYLVARLTGAAWMDHGLASTTMLYDLRRGAYAEELLARFGIAPRELPALVEASARAGPLTALGAELSGLPPGIPVAVGTGDDFATPLGVGLVAPGRLVAVLGTAEVVGALHPEPVIDPGGLVETHPYPAGGYFVENPGWLSGGAVAWVRELCGFTDHAELDAEAEAAGPGAGGVRFIPGLSGAMAPEWHAGARGCFYGLTAATERRHLARAVLEGCAFAMRDVAERLREMGVAFDSVLLLGGGARSPLWAQLRADLLGLPVAVPAIVDTCALGAAMLAAVAVGAQPDLAACAAAVHAECTPFVPHPAMRSTYDRAYGDYRRLFSALKPLFESAA